MIQFQVLMRSKSKKCRTRRTASASRKGKREMGKSMLLLKKAPLLKEVEEVFWVSVTMAVTLIVTNN